MGRIAVVGAGGRLGRTVAEILADEGHEIVPVSRTGAPVPWHEVLDRVAAVVSTLGPWYPEAREIVAAARDVGTAYLDPIHSSGWALETGGADDDGSLRTGIGVVGLVGALLARVAATTVGEAVSAHVAHLSPLVATAGMRRALVHALGQPTHVIAGGARAQEPIAQRQRPAYLPHPIGPRRAVAFPSVEPLLVSRWLPALREARAYAALPGWTVALLPLATTLARRGRATAVLEVMTAAAPTRGGRWAVVADVSDGEATARAWAHGVNVHDATAHLLAATITAARSSLPLPDAEVLLDGLGRRCGVRWAVRPPEDAGHR